MCYYNGQKVTRAEFIRLKQLEKAVANYDFLNRDLQQGFEYGMNAVLKPVEGKEDFDLVLMEWGFIPDPGRWPFVETRQQLTNMRRGYTDARGKFNPPITTLNAVSEEILQPTKIYRDAALKRRCLILSSGFYEWRHIYPIGKKTGKPLKTAVTYPYHITLKGKEYFYMAGVWQPWTDAETGEYVESFAIVTTAANKLMEQVHNTKKRMPAILNEDLAYEWMFGNLDEKRIAEIAKTQYPAEEMEAYTIAKDFRTALDPTEPFKYEDLPALEVTS
jgi:putative SOS response-associated peptidase YedK